MVLPKMTIAAEDETWIEKYLFNGDTHSQVVWFAKQGYLPVIGSILYLCFVYFGPRYMANRKRFELRKEMMIWSLALTLFSMAAVNRGVLQFAQYSLSIGFRASVCISEPATSIPIYRFWSLAMVYSKFVEYGDTVFIVLRKNKLPFLHWYHHLTVAIFTWFNLLETQPGTYFFCCMNYFVHAIMYFYYTMKAARFTPPKAFAIFITILQTSQMFVGCAILGGMVYWGNDEDCKSTLQQRATGIIMYGSYLILFLNFFYHSYIRKTPKKNEKGLSTSNKERMVSNKKSE